MEQIQQAYGFPKETVTTIMIFCKNMKAMVHSLDGSTNFNIVAGVLPGDTLSTISIYNLLRLHTMNINRSNKRKWLHIKKDKK